MIKPLPFFFLLIILISLTSCKYRLTDAFYRKNTILERTKPILTIDAPDTNNKPVYSAVIINDIHFGANKTRRDEAFCNWFRTQCEQEDETKRPRFMINLGDTTECGYEQSFKEYLAFCDEIKAIAKDVYKNDSFKIYNTTGNHDMYNDGWDNFSKLLYPYTSYYRFTTKSSSSEKGFSWYFLDSASGSLGNKQISDLKNNTINDKNPKVVLTHFPLYGNDVLYFTTQNTEERDILLDLFAKTDVKLLLHGHYHPGSFFDYGKFQEIGNQGYLRYSNCAVVTVDERSGSYSFKTFNY